MDKIKEPQKTRHLKPTIVPFEKLEDGKYEFGDSGEEFNSLPSWVDIERAKRGQKFVQKYFYCVFYSHVIALLVIFTNKNIRNILLFTEKSNTVKKAVVRYFFTIVQVVVWYFSEIKEDLNCEFFKVIKNVRQSHKSVAFGLEKKMPDFSQPRIKDTEEEEQQQKQEQSKGGGKKIVKRFWRAVKSDVESAYPFYSPTLSQEKRKMKGGQQPNTSNQYYFSQYEMTLVQWSFCLAAHSPQKFGITDATKEELGDYIHLWSIIGHALGIKPEYNLCLGASFDEYQSYSKQIFDKIIFPGFFQLNYDVEVLWEAMAKGLESELSIANYEFFLILLTQDFLDVKPENLKKLCDFSSKLRYFVWKYSICPVIKHSSWVRKKINEYLWNLTNKASLKYFNTELGDFKKLSVCSFNPPKTSSS